MCWYMYMCRYDEWEVSSDDTIGLYTEASLTILYVHVHASALQENKLK